MINRRAVARWGLGSVAAATLGTTGLVHAQSGKPVRIVVPFGAGGVADLTARTVGQKLAELLGRPVVIDNKPGAGGVGAGEIVARAEPDGNTLLLISNGTAVTAGLFKSLPFDTLKDFAPVSTLATFDIGIVAPQDSKFKSFADLVAFAKANPGKLNVGSINIGSTQNLTAELFKSVAGVDVQIVPFNGTPAVVTALRGGQIDAAAEILGPIMPQITSKALKVLAVTSTKRSRLLPDVPTAVEGGLPGLVASSWNGLAAPAKTPKNLIAELNKQVVAAVNAPDVASKLQAMNVDPDSSTPEQAAELLASDTKRWGDIIVRAKIPQQ